MKFLLVLAVFGFIFWMYWSALRDLYLGIKGRRMKSKLKKLQDEAISEEAREIIKAGKKRNVNRLGDLINAASLDTIRELIVLNFRSPLVEKFAQGNQDNPRARYLYGHYLNKKAWDARGGGFADSISNKNAETFLGLQRKAELEFLRAYEMDQSFVGIFSVLISIEIGSGNRQKAQQIYNDARRVVPDQFDYHLEMLILLTEKWLGSDEEMFEFARENADRASNTGGALNGLIPAAHFEIWLVLEEGEDEDYFNKPLVQEEIQLAYEGFKNLSKGDGFSQQHQRYLALNYFAFTFQMMGDYKTACTIYEEIGGHHGGRPWANIHPTPGLGYLEYRNRAFKGK